MEGDGHTTSTRDGVKAWVKQLREVVFKIEDIVDEHMLHLSHGHPHRPLGLVDSLHKVCTCIVKLKLQHHIGSQIRKTKAHVHEIKQTSAWEVAFKIEDIVDEYTHHLSHGHPHRSLGLIDSLHKVCTCIVKRKLQHHIAFQIPKTKAHVHEIKQTSVWYGFGSIEHGSTNVSNSQKISWYDPRKEALYLCEAEVVGIESPRDELIGWLLDKEVKRTVILVVGMGVLGATKEPDESKEELPPSEINTMNKVKLIEKLIDYLQPKRYVIFFDDIWKLDFWGEVEHALLNNKNSGRIVITTRSMDVANFCKKSSPVYIYKLKPLPLDMSLELFCKKVFQFEYDQRHCPPELEELSHEILERCDGLPLAIVSIAGLLSTRDKIIHEWQKLNDSLNSDFESNPHLTTIGFFNHNNKDKTLEATAQEYLTDLVHRSLVQVSKVDLNGKSTTYYIHDLLREIILNKMKSLSFCYYHDYEMNVCVARLRGIKVERGIGCLKDLRKLSYLNASEMGLRRSKSCKC
nr:disease resistance protein RPM1-like [Ziziphus jujuba var. spinosa]